MPVSGAHLQMSEEWLKAFSNDIAKQCRKVLIILDNFPANKVSVPLEAVCVCGFPAVKFDLCVLAIGQGHHSISEML